MERSDRPGSETVIDPRLAKPRLKEGLIPPDTGIYLRIEEGSGRGRVYTLSTGGVYLIGRTGADIPLDDTKVSRGIWRRPTGRSSTASASRIAPRWRTAT
jgi:hypothetical protein